MKLHVNHCWEFMGLVSYHDGNYETDQMLVHNRGKFLKKLVVCQWDSITG